MKLEFRNGFDWARVAWGKPDSPVRSLCSYCHAGLPEVPLMLWRPDGSAMSLCDDCVNAYLGMVANDANDDD